MSGTQPPACATAKSNLSALRCSLCPDCPVNSRPCRIFPPTWVRDVVRRRYATGPNWTTGRAANGVPAPSTMAAGWTARPALQTSAKKREARNNCAAADIQASWNATPVRVAARCTLARAGLAATLREAYRLEAASPVDTIAPGRQAEAGRPARRNRAGEVARSAAADRRANGRQCWAWVRRFLATLQQAGAGLAVPGAASR